MTCAILCGGLATRLRPLTENIPKSLIAISGEPFIVHQLKLLRANGIGQVVLCTGYLGDMIQSVVSDGRQLGLEVRYSADGPRPLGTAGAIRKAIDILPNSFCVLYGDSYLPCDYSAIYPAFDSSQVSAMMTIYRNKDAYDVSNVEAIEGRIVRYDKRDRTPAMQYIDYGLSVFRRSVFEALPIDEPYDLAQIYQDLIAKGQLASFEVQQRFYEIGSPQGIRDLEEYLSRCKSTENL